MSNEVCGPDESEASASPPGTMLALIERCVHDPKADVDKLERLWVMYREEKAARALQEFNVAMNLAQEEIQPVVRETKNTVTRSFYAKLEAVDVAIRPIYLRHGFSLSDSDAPPQVPGNVRIECRCAHVGGHTERYGREAPPDTLGPKGSPTKTALHGAASTETFLRRYIRCGIFNVVFKDMDNDGNGGYVDDAQLEYLRGLIQKLHALRPQSNEATLCTYLGITTLSELPQLLHDKAKSALEEAIATRSRSAPADRPEGSSNRSETATLVLPSQVASRPSGRTKPGMR